MENQIAPTQLGGLAKKKSTFGLAEKLILMRFHPRMIMMDLAAGSWFIYFLWSHEWERAVVAILIGRAIGYALVRTLDLEKMAQTTLGRLALLHLNPINLTLQAASVVPIFYGLWIHSTVFLLIGLTILLVGHLFGWERVDVRFSTSQNSATEL